MILPTNKTLLSFSVLLGLFTTSQITVANTNSKTAQDSNIAIYPNSFSATSYADKKTSFLSKAYAEISITNTAQTDLIITPPEVPIQTTSGQELQVTFSSSCLKKPLHFLETCVLQAQVMPDQITENVSATVSFYVYHDLKRHLISIPLSVDIQQQTNFMPEYYLNNAGFPHFWYESKNSTTKADSFFDIKSGATIVLPPSDTTQNHTVATRVDGPGIISFIWSNHVAAAETDAGSLSFSINGEAVLLSASPQLNQPFSIFTPHETNVLSWTTNQGAKISNLNVESTNYLKSLDAGFTTCVYRSSFSVVPSTYSHIPTCQDNSTITNLSNSANALTYTTREREIDQDLIADAIRQNALAQQRRDREIQANAQRAFEEQTREQEARIEQECRFQEVSNSSFNDNFSFNRNSTSFCQRSGSGSSDIFILLALLTLIGIQKWRFLK